MNGREALKALADGKRVRRRQWDVRSFIWFSLDGVTHSDGQPSFVMEADDWEIVEEPATDKDLIAEMERRAAEQFETAHGRCVAGAFRICARMLRERKVKP